MIDFIQFLAQAATPDTLPGWITTGSSIGGFGILGWLLYRAEKRLDEQQKRNDACEERYRTMVDKYAEKTFDTVQAVRESTATVRSLMERDRG